MVFALLYGSYTQFVVFRETWIVSERIPTEGAKINLVGFSLDEVWDSIVMQIGHIELEQGLTLDEQILKNEHNACICKKISALEKKIKSAHQNHVKRELFAKIQELKEELQ